MAKGIRELRARIRGVQNIQQITRAMEMVATTKLKRLQGRAEGARPYAERLRQLVLRLASSVGASISPLLELRPVKRVGVLLVTSDKGLCGAYNTNILREMNAFLESRSQVEVKLHLLGSKARIAYKRKPALIEKAYPDATEKISFRRVRDIVQELVKAFLSGQYDEVYIAHTRFLSSISQKAAVRKILPIDPAGLQAEAEPVSGGDVILEPSADEIFRRLLPKHLELGTYAAVLESLASEFAMRRAAMKKATDAAGDMIDMLRRQYNRARQETITKELLEVVGGAEALK